MYGLPSYITYFSQNTFEIELHVLTELHMKLYHIQIRIIYHFYFNFLDLESKDDGPNKTQDQSSVAIYYIFSPNVFKLNLNNNKRVEGKKFLKS